MIIPGILFLLGLLCLIKGGDWFVDGASALARRFHLPELLIGATVVSIGTTLPEVMVSTISAVSGPARWTRSPCVCRWLSSLQLRPSTAWQLTAWAALPVRWAC